MNNIKNICVFSSSSNNINKAYFQASRELGVLMGQNGFNLIYGGGALGLMYENARAVKEFGGGVIGVIPEKLHIPEVGDGKCNELIVTKCMRSRKEKLDSLSDAVIALAGGYGTLEELSEMIVQKQLGYSTKAIVILNTNGFYNNLIEFFNDMTTQNFATEAIKECYFVANTPREAINYLKTYQPRSFNVKEKLSAK